MDTGAAIAILVESTTIEELAYRWNSNIQQWKELFDYESLLTLIAAKDNMKQQLLRGRESRPAMSEPPHNVPRSILRYDCWAGCLHYYHLGGVWECRTLDGNHDLKNPDFVCPKTQAGFRYCLPRDMWPVEDQ
jgi:hypothetical protein